MAHFHLIIQAINTAANTCFEAPQLDRLATHLTVIAAEQC